MLIYKCEIKPHTFPYPDYTYQCARPVSISVGMWRTINNMPLTIETITLVQFGIEITRTLTPLRTEYKVYILPLTEHVITPRPLTCYNSNTNMDIEEIVRNCMDSIYRLLKHYDCIDTKFNF